MTRRALVAVATLVGVLLIAAPARAEWVWPVRGEVITPYRNGDDPYASGQHRGIDIAADTGTPVVAAAGGEVRFAGTAGSSGLVVSIRTDDGLLDTSYLHLSSTAVGEGQRVAAGERVGAVGSTGARSAEPPHLHFGVRDAGSRHAYHDPLAFLPPAAVSPERPRPTPAPSPAPAPLIPGSTPEPVRIPAVRRAPEDIRAPRAVPRGAPVPRSAPVPRRSPVPRSSPAPHGLPSPRGALGAQPAPGRPVPGQRREPTPLPSPAHRYAPAAGHADPLSGGQRPGDPTSGPDLGWALACLGLVLAAAVLGLSEDGREATRRSRDRLAGVLRPLLGRR